MISLVITSCGRVELLKRTFDSFMRYNDVPLSQIVLIDDSGDNHKHDLILKYFNRYNLDLDIRLIFNETNIGQVNSIDRAYERVTSDLIFHLEEDWEFIRSGFMSQSLEIINNFPKIFTVWLRGTEDTNGHGVELALFEKNGVKYRYMATHQVGGCWHGYTWNPGMRRLRDYQKVAPYSNFICEGDFAALTECRIGQRYFEKGFNSVSLLDKYVKHIG